MWKFLRSLFGSKSCPARTSQRRAPHRTSSGPSDGNAAPWSSIEPLPEVPSLDVLEGMDIFVLDEEHDLELRVEGRIERGELKLSHLPSTAIAVMQLAAKPGASTEEVVKTIESDPVLCTELLKTANSVLYGARVTTQSIRDAVMRIGMRSIRTMILGLSLRNALLRTNNLKAYGEKVWRQAFTVASIARSVADRVGFESGHAFLLGLLHDIGKVAILDTLSKELEDDTELTPALVGRLFLRWHEVAGRSMAVCWKLSPELTSVCGNHHDFGTNEDFQKSAAFVALCHRMELFLSLDAEKEFDELAQAVEFDVLGTPQKERQAIMVQALRTYRALHPPEVAATEAEESGGGTLAA